MAKPAELEKLTGVASRFGAFVAERYPFALIEAVDAWEATTGEHEPKDEAAFEALRPAFRRELDVREGMRRWVPVLERHIRQAPEQWSVFEPVWRR